MECEWSMVEYCTVNDGTTLNAYDLLKDILYALNEVCVKGLYSLRLIASTIKFFFPSAQIAIPIITDGVVVVPQLEEKRFWGVQFKVFNMYTPVFPLPKKSINDIWRDFIAPHDYFLNGTEYFFYKDGESYTQGVYMDPVRKIGILSDTPSLLVDASLITIIFKIFASLGLGTMARSFYQYFMVTKKYSRILDALDDLETDTQDLDLNHDELMAKLANIESVLGVRLFLR